LSVRSGAFECQRRAARSVALRGEPYRSGFTSTDIDALLAAQGFNCHEHARTPKLLQRYAPVHVSRPAGNDWQAITIAQRIGPCEHPPTG
jgi:hypothetical protein